MNINTLEIISGIETEATQLMLMLRSVPNLGDMAQTLHGLSIAALQATELMMPLPDYEGAARQSGWVTAEMTAGMIVKPVLGEPLAMGALTWKEACEKEGLVVPAFPCTGVFITTSLLGAMLELHGERIERGMFGWCLWADFREQQKRDYLLRVLAVIYTHSEVWKMQANALVERYAAQQKAELEGA